MKSRSLQQEIKSSLSCFPNPLLFGALRAYCQTPALASGCQWDQDPIWLISKISLLRHKVQTLLWMLKMMKNLLFLKTQECIKQKRMQCNKAQNQSTTYMSYWSLLHCPLTELVHRVAQDLRCLFLEAWWSQRRIIQADFRFYGLSAQKDFEILCLLES